MTRSKALLPVLVLLVAAGAYWFLLLAPKREEATALGAQITEAETQLQAAEATVASYATARKSYKANYTRVTSLGKAVPADDDVRSLLVQLDATAAESDVDFQTLDTGQSGAAASGTTGAEAPTGQAAPPPGSVPFGSAGMAAMPFSFTLTGQFGKLSSLLGDLEQFVTVHDKQIDVKGRLMRIESLSLAPGTGGFPAIRAQIQATTYLMPATTGVSGAPEAPAPTDGAASAAAASGDAPPVPQAAVITPPTGAAR